MGDKTPSFKFLKRNGHTGSCGPKHHGKVLVRERNLMIIQPVVGSNSHRASRSSFLWRPLANAVSAIWFMKS